MTTLQTLVEAVQNGDEAEAVVAAKKVIQDGEAVDEIVEALTAGMREVGDRFARMEIFLPEMMLAAQAMRSVMIVITLLRVQGFEVYDLGINVNALDFVRKAEEVHADIIGVSSLMTTTLPSQKEIIEFLKEKGIRDEHHVILGGAPVTREWVEKCGADSWGEIAGVTVEILERVMTERRMQGAAVQECYDVRTARPLPWYLDMYKNVKDQVAAMGVEFPY